MLLLWNLAVGIAGVALIAAACVALRACSARELSVRSVGALCLGAAGGHAVAQAVHLSAELPSLGAVGLALWVAAAMWERRGQYLRRSGDWLPPGSTM